MDEAKDFTRDGNKERNLIESMKKAIEPKMALLRDPKRKHAIALEIVKDRQRIARHSKYLNKIENLTAQLEQMVHVAKLAEKAETVNRLMNKMGLEKEMKKSRKLLRELQKNSQQVESMGENFDSIEGPSEIDEEMETNEAAKALLDYAEEVENLELDAVLSMLPKPPVNKIEVVENS